VTIEKANPGYVTNTGDNDNDLKIKKLPWRHQINASFHCSILRTGWIKAFLLQKLPNCRGIGCDTRDLRAPKIDGPVISASRFTPLWISSPECELVLVFASNIEFSKSDRKSLLRVFWTLSSCSTAHSDRVKPTIMSWAPHGKGHVARKRG
jgi:hypothetical protein